MRLDCGRPDRAGEDGTAFRSTELILVMFCEVGGRDEFLGFDEDLDPPECPKRRRLKAILVA